MAVTPDNAVAAPAACHAYQNATKLAQIDMPQSAHKRLQTTASEPCTCITRLSTRQPHGGMIGPHLLSIGLPNRGSQEWAAEMSNCPLQQASAKKSSISKGFKRCASKRDKTQQKVYKSGKQKNDLTGATRNQRHPAALACLPHGASQHTATQVAASHSNPASRCPRSEASCTQQHAQGGSALPPSCSSWPGASHHLAKQAAAT